MRPHSQRGSTQDRTIRRARPDDISTRMSRRGGTPPTKREHSDVIETAQSTRHQQGARPLGTRSITFRALEARLTLAWQYDQERGARRKSCGKSEPYPRPVDQSGPSVTTLTLGVGNARLDHEWKYSMRSSRLRITRPDGTVIDVPAPDRRTLRRIRESTTLTDREKAEMFTDCPVCSARAGRACRNRAGRPGWHRERLDAWIEQARPVRKGTPTMGDMNSLIVARRETGSPSTLYLAAPVNAATSDASLVEAPGDALRFLHPEPARRQAIKLRRTLSDEWTVTVEDA